MFAGVARRMGWPEAFAYDAAEQIFAEHAALSAFENNGQRGFDLGALSSTDDLHTSTQWPASAHGVTRGGRLFTDGRFFTPDRRARLVPTPFRPVAAKTDRRAPFLLNTGRVRDQWHTMTRTGHVARLMAHQEEPFLELHPRDAKKLGVEDGDLLRIDTEHASTVLRAKANDGIRPGEVFAPMHWTQEFASSGPIARLVGAICDPVSGQPELKAIAARVAPLPTLWRAILINGKASLTPDGFYCARIPQPAGTIHELRGWDPLPVGPRIEALLDQFFDKTTVTEQVTEIDEERGIYRQAIVTDGCLSAVFFASRGKTSPFPERDLIMSMFGTPFDADARARLFEPGPVSTGRPSRDSNVCACFSVGRAAIEQAIIARQLTRADQVGACLKAGTNCGSCLPEIDGILRDVHASLTSA
jgi:assimilatory nitrate reductase catalytic subunit